MATSAKNRKRTGRAISAGEGGRFGAVGGTGVRSLRSGSVRFREWGGEVAFSKRTTTSCFLRPSSPLPFHAQVSHSFPTDPFVSPAAGVCRGRYRPRGPRTLFIARCRRPSAFDAASTILEAGIETSNCCWNRRRARYRFSWARLKSWLGKSSPDALCTGTVAATSAGAGAGAIRLPTLASSTLGAHREWASRI